MTPQEPDPVICYRMKTDRVIYCLQPWCSEKQLLSPADVERGRSFLACAKSVP
jgi:hypothetical protein